MVELAELFKEIVVVEPGWARDCEVAVRVLPFCKREGLEFDVLGEGCARHLIVEALLPSFLEELVRHRHFQLLVLVRRRRFSCPGLVGLGKGIDVCHSKFKN